MVLKKYLNLLLVFTLLFNPSITPATLVNTDKQQLGQEANQLTNGGFENGTAGWGRYSEAAENNTFTDAGDLVNVTAHGLINGDRIVFTSITTTTGASTNTIYYVISSLANSFQISATSGGSAVTLTTDGSGQFKRLKPLLPPSGGSPNVTIGTTTTNPIEGAVSGVLTKDAAMRIGEGWHYAFTLPANAAGTVQEFSLAYYVNSGTYNSGDATFYLYDDTNDTLQYTLPLTNTSSSAKQYFNGSFIAGATSYKAVIAVTGTNASAFALKPDSFRVYASTPKIMNVAQAQFVGESYIAGTANCTAWTRASATLGAFASDTDCPGPTIVSAQLGSWQTTDANLPVQTINNLGPGFYKVTIQGKEAPTTAHSLFAVSDGTTTSQGAAGTHSGSVTGGNFTAIGFFNYTGSGNRSFELYGASSGTVTVSNGITSPVSSLRFLIERYPNASEIATTTDQRPGSWAGYHDSTCAFTRAAATMADPAADATCAFTEVKNVNFGTVTSALSGSDKLPGIVFTPKRTGSYLVCVSYGAATSSGVAKEQLLDIDGSTILAFAGDAAQYRHASLCGIATASSTSSSTIKLQTAASAGTHTLGGVTGVTTSPVAHAIDWTIVSIDQGLPQPTILNQVSTPASGGKKTCSGFIANSGTPTVTRSEGNCVSSVTDNGVGDFTINFVSGTFSSAPWHCSAAPSHTTNVCWVLDNTTALSASAVRYQFFSCTTGSAVDQDFTFECAGPK